MALDLDGQVVHELVAVLDAVFEEEAVTDDVVGHVVLDAHVIGAMHGHAAVVGVVDGGILDVLALGVAHQMPVDRIARQLHVLAHAIELDALDEHLARDHRHDVAALEGLLRIGRGLDLDVARQQTHFAALIHVEGDLAEVHVVELLVERDRVAADGGNGATLGLARIEIRGGEDDLVADPPAGGVQHLDRGGACRRPWRTAWSRCWCGHRAGSACRPRA